MKKWKRILAVIFCICWMVVSLPATASAESGDKYIAYYADGSYSVVSITYEDQQNISLRAVQNTRRGTKTENHYDKSDKLVWSFVVHGEFTYDGRTAEATDADYSYDIYDSDWSFESGSASYSGATATATGEFKHIFPHSSTLRLTCSADGKLS